jgi:hypothetical protein
MRACLLLVLKMKTVAGLQVAGQIQLLFNFWTCDLKTCDLRLCFLAFGHVTCNHVFIGFLKLQSDGAGFAVSDLPIVYLHNGHDF